MVAVRGRRCFWRESGKEGEVEERRDEMEAGKKKRVKRSTAQQTEETGLSLGAGGWINCPWHRPQQDK